MVILISLQGLGDSDTLTRATRASSSDSLTDCLPSTRQTTLWQRATYYLRHGLRVFSNLPLCAIQCERCKSVRFISTPTVGSFSSQHGPTIKVLYIVSIILCGGDSLPMLTGEAKPTTESRGRKRTAHAILTEESDNTFVLVVDSDYCIRRQKSTGLFFFR